MVVRFLDLCWIILKRIITFIANLKIISIYHTCVQLIGAVLQSQEVINHGRLSYTPGSQEQHHGFGGNLSICQVRSENNNYNLCWIYDDTNPQVHPKFKMR